MAPGEVHFQYYKDKWWAISLLEVLTIAGTIIFGIWNKDLWGHPFWQYLVLYIIWLELNWTFARWIDPDLDQKGSSLSEGRAMQELSCLGSVFLVPYFSAYAGVTGFLCKFLHIGHREHEGAHRSIITHGIIGPIPIALPGTIGRMIWWNLPIVVLLSLIKHSEWLAIPLVSVPYLMAQFHAWTITDSIHVFLDWHPAYRGYSTALKSRMEVRSSLEYPRSRQSREGYDYNRKVE